MELVLGKIADDLDVQVSDEELDIILKEMVESQPGQTVEEFKSQIEAEHGLEEGLAPYRHHLKRRKTIDAIKEAAKITQVDTLTPPESESEEEAQEPAAQEAPETPKGSDTEG